MTMAFMGQITMMGFGFAPRGYAACNGQMMSVSQNQALFSLLGIQYGGDGRTTFALPNLQSASPVGAGPSVDPLWQPQPYVQGALAGAETVTLQSSNVVAHVHTLMATTMAGGDGDPSDGELFATATAPIYVTPQNGVSLGGGPLGSDVSTPHPNMQPFTVVNMCMALTGVYPTRN